MFVRISPWCTVLLWCGVLDSSDCQPIFLVFCEGSHLACLAYKSEGIFSFLSVYKYSHSWFINKTQYWVNCHRLGRCLVSSDLTGRVFDWTTFSFEQMILVRVRMWLWSLVYNIKIISWLCFFDAWRVCLAENSVNQVSYQNASTHTHCCFTTLCVLWPPCISKAESGGWPWNCLTR